jgi:hypothetical protein
MIYFAGGVGAEAFLSGVFAGREYETGAGSIGFATIENKETYVAWTGASQSGE